MASRLQSELPRQAQAGDILLVVHEFVARSPDELSLAKGDRIELIERDDDFGDGWYLGRHLQNGNTGLFPEVYTTTAPRTAPAANNKPKMQSARSPAASATSKFAPATSKPPVKAETEDETPAASEANSLGSLAANAPPPARPDPAPTTSIPEPVVASVSPPLESPSARSLGSSETGNYSPQQPSTVMNETLSVIDEHITNMNTPNRLDPSSSPMPSIGERRPSLVSHDSGSQYSTNTSQTRLAAYVAGSETEEEDDGRLTEAEVSKWSPAKVAEYLEGVGVERAHCELFRDEEFTGEVILQMEQSQVFMKEFNLGPIGRRMRTWQKIKSLQDEVKMAKAAALARASQPGANQSMPSQRGTSPGGSALRSGQSSPRPSAASIRNMGHRRHSSTERPLNTAYRSPPPSDYPARAKQSSFDRSWTMGGASAIAAGASSSYSNGSRTIAPTHLHSVSADTGALAKASTGSSQVSLPTPTEADKGYVSGGDFDSRRMRNVLRRKDTSEDHSRAASHTSEKRKSASFFWQRNRAESETKAVDTNDQSVVSHRDGVRIVSEPIQGNQTSPTVTRLEYDDDQGRGYRDSSSKIPPVENKRASTASETTQTSSRRGFRTISDAITGREKSLITSMDRFMPGDNSMTASPDRTSSTPSGTTPTADQDAANTSEFSTPAQGVLTSGTRRKSKKATSAYVRGLEKKSPQIQMDGCDHSGWMRKKSSNLITTWKPRLFVLRGRRLSYYYSEQDVEEKGLIDISNHRVLPADSDFITSMHAALTGANAASPTSPQSGTDPNTPTTPYSDGPPSATTSGPSPFASPGKYSNASDSSNQTFLFKLVPPRSGLSKGVNFTRPSVHYFAVPSRAEGRKWMAALMKATIDRDETSKVITTYQQKTISLEQARARKERPPFLMGLGEEEEGQDTTAGAQEPSLGGDTAVTNSTADGEGGGGGGGFNDDVSTTTSATDFARNDGSELAPDNESGLGIQGLGTGNETADGASRMKAAGVWS